MGRDGSIKLVPAWRRGQEGAAEIGGAGGESLDSLPRDKALGTRDLSLS